MVIDGSGDDYDITDDEELNFNQFENMPGKPRDFTFFVAGFNIFYNFLNCIWTWVLDLNYEKNRILVDTWTIKVMCELC